MRTLRVAFIIALANVIIISGFVVGWFILAVALVLALIYFSYEFLFQKIQKENDNGKKTLLKKIFSFIATIFIYFSLIFAYITYTLHSTPLRKSLLENRKLIRLLRFTNFNYIDGISNYSYATLAKNFRQDLKRYAKNELTNKDIEFIWKKSLENLKLINNIQRTLNKASAVKVKGNLWNYKIYFYQIPHSFYIDSTTFLVYIGSTIGNADIKIDFDINKKDTKKFKILKTSNERVKIYMPYIRRNFYINKKDKEIFENIAKYLDIINSNLEKNKRFFKNKK